MPILPIFVSMLELMIDLFLDLLFQLLKLSVGGCWLFCSRVICPRCCASTSVWIISIKFEVGLHILDLSGV